MDSRGKLSGTGIYDNAANILDGIRRRDNQMKYAPNELIGGLTQVARVAGYTFNHLANGTMNFTVGYQPYHNEAHHLIPVEVFYADEWDTPHLHIVKSAKENPDDKEAPGYNINNPDNIIILPQCCGALHYMHYHALPDHSRNHPGYNTRMVQECQPIFDMADEALNEPDCDRKKDLRKQIYDKLKEIEKDNFERLEKRGPKPMP